ncbi:MAG TPA: hypothetical protein VFE98_00200 [Candidatus Bathyarchaeia archaeon]|nr:hypothetical protein [Candidatus Bathyarchaeia archaeon]
MDSRGDVNTPNVAFALALIGGILMLVLPLAPLQFEGPACFQGSPCSMIPAWVPAWLFVVMVIDICSGVAATFTVLILKVASARRHPLLGWVLISISTVYLTGLIISVVISVISNTGGLLGIGIPGFLGPLLVLIGGRMLAKKHPT